MKLIRLLRYSKKQELVISEIFRDVAQVFFASAVVTPLLIGADNSSWIVLLSGIFLSGSFWISSVIIIKS